jgi:RimJ/RimL family protein N-acetyltransferase
MIPELATPRLRLRPLVRPDVDRVAPLYADPEVNRFISAGPITPTQARDQVLRRLAVPAPDGLGYWVLDTGAELVGVVKLLPSTELPSELVEVGWRLARSHWGRGLAAEAVRAMLRHGFDTVGLPAVWALIRPNNVASVLLARRLGFLHVGSGPHRHFDHQLHVRLADPQPAA